jgi:alpha-galactosidase
VHTAIDGTCRDRDTLRIEVSSSTITCRADATPFALERLREVPMTSRREFVQYGAISALGLVLPGGGLLRADSPRAPGRSGRSGGFVDLRRPPDEVTVQTEAAYLGLIAGRGERWQTGRIVVRCTPAADALRITLGAPADAVRRLHLRWHGDLSAVQLLLGDAWERAYGDLEWRGLAPDRVMPWYVAAWDGSATHGYGVRTGAGAMCFWRVDPDGISLWTDVRSGGAGVQLGERELAVCDVLCREGHPHESPFAALHRFCGIMSPAPRLPDHAVYGHNDWYYAYGNNSAESVRADAQRIVDVSPTGGNRPYAVIDDGWQPERGADKKGVGEWDRGNERFPDMPGLASEMVRAGTRPGIWIRPLQAPATAPDSWRLPRQRSMLDPTVEGVLDKVAADIARLRQWGFQLIKHDYSTFDILGRWGRQMGASPTRDGWSFAQGSGRTTAEVISGFYATIRRAAGDGLIIGCNTVSHLSAGIFEMCRIGDDTSGTDWLRVPEMGVNALAFRGVQQGAFYTADPDCVGVTRDIPWERNRQWLELLAASGTMTFVSLAPDALGDAQRRDLRAALAVAAAPQPAGEPLDWQRTEWPRQWRLRGSERTFDWSGPSGLGASG